MDTSVTNTWNVLIVRPRSEKKVGLQLKDLGFESCVPVQKQVKKWSDRKKIQEVVLFQNYVFVETNPKIKAEVFTIANVVKYLQFEHRPAIIRPYEMELIKQLGTVQNKITISYDGFCAGDFVEINTGPFAGQQARIIAIDGSDHIRLSIPSLNCFANVQLKGEKINRLGIKV